MGNNVLVAVAAGVFAGAVAGLAGGTLAGLLTRGDSNKRISELERQVSVVRADDSETRDRLIAVQKTTKLLAGRANAFYCTVDQDTEQSVCQPSIGDCVYMANVMMATHRKRMTACWASVTAFCTAPDGDAHTQYCARDEMGCEQLRASQGLGGKKMSPCKETPGG